MSSPISPAEWTQLMRFLSGDLSPEEADAFAREIAANPILRREHALLSRAWQATPLDRGLTREEIEADRTSVQARLQRPKDATARRLDATALRTERPSRTRHGMWSPRHPWAFRSLGIAGMVVALVGLFYGWQHAFGRQQMTSPRVYATTVAQQTVIHLTDGTRVTLAPQTTLTIGQDFNHHTRTVTLNGEALFDVSNHTSAPFIVRTGHLTTRVLGTQFDVRRYAQDRTTQVAVTEGKVMVSGIPLPSTSSQTSTPPARMAMVLVAGTMGRISDTTAVATAVPNITDYTRWAQGVIVFRRTPVPEVLATLEHWYGLTFRLTDSTLAAQHITATFDHRSIADVLATLRILLNASMTFDSANVVTVHVQRPRSGTAPARNTTEKFSSLHKEAGR